jgi:hypothetical protein
VFAAVVFRSNDNASLLVGQVRDNVSLSFVVVDTQCDDEIFTGVGHETKGARCPAAAHSEHMSVVNFTPRPPVRVLPNRLLDDVEECVLIRLEDPSSNCVSHSMVSGGN